VTIYFVEMEGENAIKIGYSAGSVERRIATLQTGQPRKMLLLGTIPGSMDDERSLHQELKQYRRNGEWFDYTHAMKEIVSHLIEKQGPWFLCRVPALKAVCMYDEWINAFGTIDADPHDRAAFIGGEGSVKSAFRSFCGAIRQAEKFARRGTLHMHGRTIGLILGQIDDYLRPAVRYLAAYNAIDTATMKRSLRSSRIPMRF
jgi:hypothetical protein